MQLKIKRSQRDTGVMSNTVAFCIDARVEFAPDEKQNIVRYKLHKQVIYNSDAAAKHLQQAAMSAASGSVIGGLKSLGSIAFAALNLNISISSLEKGQHIECKSMDELLGTEDAILVACRNLRGYLDAAATFDGREMLFDFATGMPEAVASVAAPALALAAPGAAPIFQGSVLPQSATVDPTGGPARPNFLIRLEDKVREKLPYNLKGSAQFVTFLIVFGGAVVALWLFLSIVR